MPAKEIKELRQSGRLEEALKIALEDYEYALDGKARYLLEYIHLETGEKSRSYEIKEVNKDYSLLWAKRSLSWVYYEYIKKMAHEFNFEGFIENLMKLKELDLPESEQMVFDLTAWQIGSIVFRLQKEEPVDYSKINKVFELVKEFHFSKPSESYSLLYKAFHKGYRNWSRYLGFADWWDFNNFRSEDYAKEEYNGKSIMAIAEQAYIAYSKVLLEGEPQDAFGAQKRIDKEKIKAFLPSLEALVEKHPDYHYPPYFEAKLLLALGDQEDVLKVFLPFAKRKRNDFWVWELLADSFAGDKELQLACYCKALSLHTPEDFLVKTREKFAEVLISKKMYSEAKTEIEKVVSVRQQHGWNISNQLANWMLSDWFVSQESNKDNKGFYAKHIEKADEILFQDIPEENVVVEFVNTDKKILNFIVNKRRHGYFGYKNFRIKPRIGDVLKVRLEAVGNEGFYKPLSLKQSNESISNANEALKVVKAKIEIPEGKSFGFIDGIFVTPDMISRENIKDGDEVKCKAILSFNKKKSEWGWKCYQLQVN